MGMNILLTGGTGFIGNELVKLLLNEGHKVRILTRDKEVHPPFYTWTTEDIDERVFENLDGIIHLAGAPLMSYWTSSYKKQIIDSRVNTAQLLLEKVKEHQVPLKFFISAAGSSYYGQVSTNKIFKEEDQPGKDFLADVCVRWENAAFQFEEIGARVVCIRTPLVLGKNADALKLMKLPTQYGLGASLGSGKQASPWLHIEDLCRVYLQAVENNEMNGSYNVAVSEKLTHQQFMQHLAKGLRKPLFLPNIPAFAVKLVMGEKAVIVLEGAFLDNQKLLATGFTFNYPTLDDALNEILQ